jgi:predicted DNA-binding transcriptional regulator AlpA
MESLLNQKQAARVLGISVRTLERHRVAGTGPRWARLGRLVRYRQCDLTEWVESNLRDSTSEMATHERQPATTRS